MSGPSSGPTATSSAASYPSAYAPSRSSSTLNSEPPSLHLASKAYEPNWGLSNAQGVGSRGERGTMHPTDSDLTETQPGESLRKRDSGSYRRHLQRGSGGFLLESAFTSAARPQDSRSQELADSRIIRKDNGKGIEATDAAEGWTSKQHRRHRRYHTSSSLGSSPLSREVTIAKHQHGDNEASNNRDETSALGSDGGRVSDVATTDRAAEEKLQGNTKSNQQQNTFRQDTDPLQIVNIALNLSQSRRKGTSATRFNAGNILNARRTVSAAGPGLQEVPSNGPLVGGSLKQHLQQQRRTSRNISPTPDRSIQVAASPSLRERKSGSALQAISSPRQDQEYIYSFSKSTLARAEKARVSLGLSAEYMRLLKLLPPLNANSNGSGNPYSTAPNSPITNESRNRLSRFVSGSSASGAAGDRPYNPLQYIRNRKVRARERRTIDAEADGWANLENVRNWVNMVESEASNPSFQSGDRVLLPQFPGRSQDTAIAPQFPQTGRLGRSNTANTKPKRPRVDWQISPAELFADAFWLELEGNKRLIEDSHGNKIYPHDYSVIRRDSTVESEQMAAESVIKLQRTGDRAREGFSTGSNIKMPSFTAKLEHDLDAGNGNGRRRRKIHKLRHHDDNTRFGRKSLGWRKDGSTLNDSSGASSDEEGSRGRHRGRRKDKQDIAGSQALEKLEMERELGSVSGIDAPKSDRVADTSSVANDNFATGYVHPLGASESLKALPIPIGRSQESLQRSRSGSASTNPGEGPQVPLDKFDFVPGIAANLSPLHSRASSPVRSSIIKAGAKIGLFRAERGKERENFENDLEGNYPNEQHHRQISVDTDQGSGERRGSSPIKKTASRTAGKNAGKEAHLADKKLLRDDRDEKEPESSRRRGIFKGGRKGGRIEEIVRNEVSKVGVLIRKKEGPSSNSVVSSATASSNSSSDSDRSSPVRGRSKGKRVASLSPSGSDEDRVMAVKGSPFGLPEYHPPHLPTFTSPFGHGERTPADVGTSPEGDHITRQQMAQREVRRPSKFLRHAPPKIDVNTLPELTRAGTGDSDMTRQTDTLDTSDADSRRNSYGFGSVLGNTANVHHANRRFNAMLNMPSGSKLGPPVTGLTALDASSRPRPSKRPSGSEEQRKWSISDQDVPCDFPVTRREIARLRVLWLSSGVKAQQISNRANEVKKPPSILVPDKSGLSIPRAPRSEEHILAAQIHSSEMQRTSQLLNETANFFRRSTVNDIQDRINAIREHVSVRLAPLVQDAADDADALSMEMSTKHTLAVKKLNDRVDKMIRRRKRRLKKLRKWGYVLLEWTLLGLMWWVWLIVVIVRTIRITVKGFAKGVRWLLWL